MTNIERVGFTLVLLMVLLQGFYGVFSLLAPLSFSSVRGTELFSLADADWVQIYGSRTVFIACILAYLLSTRNYVIIMWAALFGMIMPIVDGVLAFQAQAPLKVIYKHVATIIYLFIIFFVLKKVVVKNT